MVQLAKISSSATMKGKLGYLTASFVLLLVLYPFLEGGVIRQIIWNTLISVICFFGVYAVSYNRRNLVVALVFGVPWFVTTWIILLTSPVSQILGLISIISLIFFFTFTASVIFVFILRSAQVSNDVLFGAVSIYMLIGGIFNMLYLLIKTLQSGSFFVDSAYNIDGILDWTDFIYYSFATLTTVGFGDIAPVTSHARSFSIIESIIGVMYLAIIISRLVGMYIAHSKTEE